MVGSLIRFAAAASYWLPWRHAPAFAGHAICRDIAARPATAREIETPDTAA